MAPTLPELVVGMNKICGDPPLGQAVIFEEVLARDRAVTNRFSTDAQLTFIRGARTALGERIMGGCAAPTARPGRWPGRRHPRAARTGSAATTTP